MPIYTKKGDGGRTRTFNVEMSKSDQLAVALGTIDELNSWIGLCRSEIFNFQFTIYNQFSKSKFSKNKLDAELIKIQTNLMIINSILAGSQKHKFKNSETAHLEKLIDKLQKDLLELKDFIYPVGFLQVARAVARRAEREVVTISQDKNILKYLNRLSDALFVMARYANWQMGMPEEVWK
jgi:cob(I)alamin adenosyltransferase